jgi:hypothetical protein
VLPLAGVAALAVITVGSPIASAGVSILVNTTADSADGGSVCTGSPAPCSLYDAINYSDTLSSSQASPTTIELPAGTYVITAANPLPYIDSPSAEAINIDGLGSDPTQTVIDGDGTSGSGQSILSDDAVASEWNTFSNLTFQNGFSNDEGFGGGALNWAGSPSSLTLSDCIVQNNISQNDGGGAIVDTSGTSLTITGSTFQDNTVVGIIGAVASGGAIDATVPDLTISDSTFLDNTAGTSTPASSPQTSLSAQGDGGAIIVGYSAAGANFTVTDSDFSGNTAYAGYSGVGGPLKNGQGGAISDDSGPLSVSDSRLAGNEAIAGQDLAFVGGEGEGQFGSSVTADDDWWGVNTGPQANSFVSASSVSISDNTWLELELTAASPDVLDNGSGSSALQADLFETNNEGTLGGLPGLPAFATGTIFSTNFGSLAAQSSDYVNGDATATFEAPASDGVATVDATLDGQVVETSITVGAGPTITEDPQPLTVCAGDPATFNSSASGFPTPSAQWQSEPSGDSSFSNVNGATSPSYSFVTAATDNGTQFQAVYTNVFSSQTTSAATLTVNTAPVITLNPTDDSVTAGQTASFTAAATGTPTPAVQWYVEPSGSGVYAPIDGATNATYSFTAASGDNGSSYEAVFTNSCNSATTTTASLTVTGEAPGITSPDGANFVVGQFNTFTVQTSGIPTPAISESGSLPSGVTFFDDGDGTATLSGTPAPGTAGVYSLTITADNGIDPEAQQTFTLNVVQAPAITSNDSATFTVGTSGLFTVQTTGTPTPAISESGALPNGVGFVDNGDGTATLSGPPAAGTGGTYTITITASNGVLPDAQQTFTLTVLQAPEITSPRVAAFADGVPGSYTVTTLGSPAPALSERGALPTGVGFLDNGNGTATISGLTSVAPGVYNITLKASNSAGTATVPFAISVVADVPGETVTAACTGRHVRVIRLAIDILEAVGGGTLQLQPGCTYIAGVPRDPYPYEGSNGSDWFEPISVPITLDGNGSTIMQYPGTTHPARLFEVTSTGSLTAEDVSLDGGVDVSGNGGGGIFNSGSLDLTNVTMSADSTVKDQEGGAVYNAPSALATVTGSTFTHDSAYIGGAISAFDSSATISDSTFSKDVSAAGAVGEVDGSLTMVNDTVVDDSASFGGGGVLGFGGLVSITDSTLDDDIAGSSFGGAAILLLDGATGNLAGTILANANPPSAGECSIEGATLTDGGYNLSDDSSCGFTQLTSTNGSTIGQYLGSLANNGGPVETVAERIGAPSIDVVPASATDVNGYVLCSDTDARGVPRPQTGCDIGSFQTISTSTTIGASSGSVAHGTPVTFTVTVTPSSTLQIPVGSVKLYRSDGGPEVLMGSAALNGATPDQATLTTSHLPRGTWTITATYPGKNGVTGSTTAVGVIVVVS